MNLGDLFTDLNGGPHLKNHTTDYSAFLASKLKPDRPAGIEPKDLPPAPFEWQAATTRWALRRGRAALFEDCGLGKTAQQLAWAHAIVEATNRPSLILAPLGVAPQTAEEGERFGLPVERIAAQSEVSGPAVYITNYEKLHKIEPDAFGSVVLDESSILKDIGGKTRRALTAAFADTPYRLSCTATPSPNDLDELGNQAEFLGIMTAAEMRATFFINDQTESSKWRLKGHAEQAFYDWLAEWCLYIRTPGDIGFDASGYELPGHDCEAVLVEHDWHMEGMLFKVAARSLDELRAVRRNSIEERLRALDAIVNGNRDLNLTWCGLNDEGLAIAREFPDAVEVAGRHPNEFKEEMFSAFAKGEIRHLVTKGQFGYGMNWQRCSRQQFFGLDHSFEKFYQNVRRLLRFGQRREVETRVIISDVAAHVYDAVMRKQAEAERLASELASRMEESMKRQIVEKVAVAVEPPPRRVERGEGWEFYHGDSIEVIRGVADNSVGYQIKSPPFPELYTYSDSPRDLGNADWVKFWEQFDYLIPEMLRVSMSGRLCTIHCMDLPIQKQKHGYVGLRDFPGEIVKHFEAAGWRYFARRMIWKDPVIENARTHSLGHGNLLKDSAKSRAGLPDYLLTFQKPGDNPEPIGHSPGSFPVEQWQKWASPSWTARELSGEELAMLRAVPEWMLAPVWYDVRPGDTLQKESAREEQDEKHICPLQLLAIERCIEMWSNPGDLVASWFGGIGSEGFVAVRKGRRAILCELKESYWRQGCNNLRAAEAFADQPLLPLEAK